MSKTQEAKDAQGWRKTPASCGNCTHFESESVIKEYERWNGVKIGWVEEKKMRCGIGGFKVGKMNVCDRFERKEAV